ncbi:MAG: TraR/DksA family transcriptional regulator [Myxococcota bacterium]
MSTAKPGLTVLYERLRERRRALERRLGRVTGDRRREGGALDPDFAEQAVQRENDEVLDVLSDTERVELGHIDAALARIDAGCFGICDACGADIDPMRLDALPSADLCVDCATEREHTSARS